MQQAIEELNGHRVQDADSLARDVSSLFGEQIRTALAGGRTLKIQGGGTKAWYGAPSGGSVLDTRIYAGVVAYDPAELVITARSGTPLAALEDLLASHGQMLPFEPPHFGAGATLGGCVAAGLSGPRRMSAGGVRDFVLGASVMTGRGDIQRFGGQVMKNVAGYDVARLMAGSLGCLGLLMDISLKVLPRPVEAATLRFALSVDDSIRRMNEWGGKALPITASAWQDGVLSVRLEGVAAGVCSARAQLGGELLERPMADAFWQSMREQTASFFRRPAAEATLWRICVPSTTDATRLPGADSQLIEWGGAQRWVFSEGGDETIRRAALDASGHATRFRCGKPGAAVFTPLSRQLMDIHKRLKAAFDPGGVFNRGRMFPEI
ncbi:glycolate oxidase subunit GlcE [Trinickia mobilis]|uniref:glycolate oxidase subunit GlcE n=1 Tax=Trinickia mobilis TaxID=2816356 RepID=UPI001A8DB49F|nr:glycolate oxidase subunit GlcE [Trinickia mobilis]